MSIKKILLYILVVAFIYSLASQGREIADKKDCMSELQAAWNSNSNTNNIFERKPQCKKYQAEFYKDLIGKVQ